MSQLLQDGALLLYPMLLLHPLSWETDGICLFHVEMLAGEKQQEAQGCFLGFSFCFQGGAAQG